MNAQAVVARNLVSRGEIDYGHIDQTVARLVARIVVELGDLADTLSGVSYYWHHTMCLAGELARTALGDDGEHWHEVQYDDAAAERLAQLAVPVYALAEVLKVDLPHAAIQASGGLARIKNDQRAGRAVLEENCETTSQPVDGLAV